MQAGDIAPARGFTYVWMLFAVALGGVVLAGVGAAWELRVRREKEADLLAVGAEFSRALTEYYRQTPQAARELPVRLEDLLADSRGGALRRHLRRVYRDPLTGRAEWGMKLVNGRIAGVYSLAPGMPIRRDGFPPSQQGFANAPAYSAWSFDAVITAPSPSGVGEATAATATRAAPASSSVLPATASPPNNTPPTAAPARQPSGDTRGAASGPDSS